MSECRENQASGRAAMEAAENRPSEPEPERLKILMATTKSTIHKTMKTKWIVTWKEAKYGREPFRLGVKPGKQHLASRREHPERSAPLSPRRAPARLACVHTSPQSTRLTPANANVAMAHKTCGISSWNADTGQKNDIKCGQANNHAWTSNAFSTAHQWQSNQQRCYSGRVC